MLRELHGRLSSIRRRQRLDRALRFGAFGCMAGAIAGCAWRLAFWQGAVSDAGVAWLLLIGCAAIATIAGLLWPTSWRSSARLVDGVYDLKDRTLTALDFATQCETDAIKSLQVNDALLRLNAVDANRVLPWRAPRVASVALAAVAVMIAFGFLPSTQPTLIASAPTGPLDVVLDQAAVLEETMLKDLREIAEESADPALEELVQEMEQAVEELKDPKVDQREALAKLSEMQSAMSALVDQLDVHQIDAQLQQLAEALAAADAAQAASQAIQAANYDKAAKELEKIDASTMSHKQRDAVAQNLAKLGEKLDKGKQGQLSDAVQQMAEGLASENDSKTKEGMCKAAGVCRKQGMRKKISECLACQLNRLSECKGCCQGQCTTPGQSVAKSQNPSNKFGMGASKRPTGDERTKLDSQRREEDLVGVQGEGSSERETTATSEARQDAARAYRERYVEFRKQMEEVLDSEPLPLSHRETVRKYFESIRPTEQESATVEGN